MTPDATCRFCSRSARTTSPGVRFRYGEALGIEPHAHAVLAQPEQVDVAHAVDAGERVADLDEGVVADVELVVAAVGREQVDHHQEVG